MSKRDREKNIQGWFDDENPEEKVVIDAFDYLRKQYPSLAPKWILGKSLILAAQGEGFDPGSAPSDGFDSRVDALMQVINRLLFRLENGSFMQVSEAAVYADEETVQMDAISASVGSRYQPLSFEDDD